MIKVSDVAEVLHRIRSVIPNAEMYVSQEFMYCRDLGPTQTVYELEVHTADGRRHAVRSVIPDEVNVPVKVIGRELFARMTQYLYNI